MKKPLIVLFVLVSTVCFGQASFGVRAGLNLSNMAHDGPDYVFTERKSKFDFHAGVYAQFPLTKKLSLIPELLYTTRGFRREAEYLSTPKTRFNLSYIELPVLVSYSPMDWLGIDLGPSVAYQFSAHAKSDDGKNDLSNVFDKTLDVGLNAGVRVKANEKVAFVFRYYYGLRSTYETWILDINDAPTGEIKYFNRSFQFGLSYRLR